MNTNPKPAKYNVSLNTQTLFILSTSGIQSSIVKHNQALKKLGANLVYFTFNRKIDPETYANLFRSPIVRGGAVTGQGLKTGIVPFVDQVDELTKKVCAINTIVNRNGKLFGYNTDAYGFEKAVSKHIKLLGREIKTAVIYGNGGVSGVAAFVLKKMGIKTTMMGRNTKKVKVKMKSLRLSYFKGPYDLVINATPASSEPLKKAKNLNKVFKGCKMVFDHNMPEMNNKKNHLHEYCKKKKIHFAPGKDMYDPQMGKQWKLFLNGAEDNNGNKIKLTESVIAKCWKV